MEEVSKINTAPNLDYIDSLEDVQQFYQRPEGVDRNLTEVAPRPGESDKKFVERASKEFAGQYPNSNKAKRMKMGELTLEAERQQIMQEEHEKAKQEHEASIDDKYREQLTSLHQEYQTTVGELDSLLKKGVLGKKTVQDAKSEARLRWLEGRKEASGQYDAEYHKRVDAGMPSTGDFDQFRQQEIEELNQRHEQIMNYDAIRLGITSALDSGLIAKLDEGDFSTDVSVADIGDTIQRGMGGEVSLEVDRFIGNLWQPEIEVIKRNAVMRAISNPLRSEGIISRPDVDINGKRFILPIENSAFTEYVSENTKDDAGKAALCSGLSSSLMCNDRDKALERAQWFYDIAHEKAGLDAEDILTITQAFGIVQGNDKNQKWQERFNDFWAETIDWDNYDKQTLEQSPSQTELEEANMSTEELLDYLDKKIEEFGIESYGKFDSLGIDQDVEEDMPSRDDANANKDGENMIGLAKEIVRKNRWIQHRLGTEKVIDFIEGDLDFKELGIIIHEPEYHIGAWYKKKAFCMVSMAKIESTELGDKAWIFISEGAQHYDQDIYYGMTASPEEIERLFSGIYRRQTGHRPNINDLKDAKGEKKVEHIRHELMPKDIEEALKPGFSKDKRKDFEDKREYLKIARDFIDKFSKGSYMESAITKEEMDAAEAVEEKQFTDKPLEASEPIIEEVEQPNEENELSTEEIVPQMKDKELFNLILSKQSGISNRGINTLRDKNATLSQLTRTPRGAIEQMLSEQDIRKVAEILDTNGRDHPKWFDE